VSTRRRSYPYYKVQFFDERSSTWRETKRAFDTLAEAHRHAKEKLGQAKVRFVEVTEEGYHIIETSQ